MPKEKPSGSSQTTSSYVLERRLHPELRDANDIERLYKANAKRHRKLEMRHEEKKS